MITVLADKNIPFLKHFLRDDTRLLTFDPQRGLPGDVLADALLVRTVTPLNSRTVPPELAQSLRFAATASAGTDHIDHAFLLENTIPFASAAGCNAQAVAEYVATALLHWCYTHKKSPLRLMVGIVGAGHTGEATNRLLQSIGFTTVVHDPPKARKDPEFTSASKEDVLACDVITFHVPLTHEQDVYDNADPTYHWLGTEELENASIRLVINASRGGVVDERALKHAYVSGDLQDFILDVWDGEPVPVAAIVQDAWIATPHIAGYSVEAKVRATSMIVEQLYAHFNLEYPVDRPLAESHYDEYHMKIQSYLDSHEQIVYTKLPVYLPPILENIHPMFELSSALKNGVMLEKDELMDLFVSLRTSRPLRREYHNFKIPDRLAWKFPALHKLLSP